MVTLGEGVCGGAQGGDTKTAWVTLTHQGNQRSFEELWTGAND